MEAATTAEVHYDDGGGPPRGGRTGLRFGGGASPLRAAAGILLVLALTGIQIRMGMTWNAGVFVALDLIGVVIVLGWGLLAAGSPVPAAMRDFVSSADLRDEAPDGATTALLVAGLLLLLLLLGNVADVLGAEGGAGSTLWVSGVFGLVAAYPAWFLRSPICALLSSGALAVTFLALIELIFDPQSVTTYRWLFATLIVVFVVVAALLLGSQERHAVQHVNAAGLVLITLASTLYFGFASNAVGGLFLGGTPDPTFNGPLGWELVAFLGAAALVGFATLRRETGPGFIGSIGLFVVLVAAAIPEQDATLVGWPLALLIFAVAAVTAVFLTEDT